jgi:hypothetical protein
MPLTSHGLDKDNSDILTSCQMLPILPTCSIKHAYGATLRRGGAVACRSCSGVESGRRASASTSICCTAVASKCFSPVIVISYVRAMQLCFLLKHYVHDFGWHISRPAAAHMSGSCANCQVVSMQAPWCANSTQCDHAIHLQQCI